MNKILIVITLFFVAFLQASDGYEYFSFMTESNECQSPLKASRNPEFFHFKEWDERHQYSANENIPLDKLVNNLNRNCPPVDTSVSLSQCDVFQMRKKMNSITHCLIGEVFVSRINDLDEESLEINDPRIKAFVMEVAKKRIITSSSSQYDFEPLPAKGIRQLINSFALRYEDIMPKIAKEPYALNIMLFIEAELLGVREDFYRRIYYTYQQNTILRFDDIIDNKKYNLRFVAKNAENMVDIIKSYKSIQLNYKLIPASEKQVRHLLKQLFLLEQAIICDKNVKKASLQSSYLEIEQLYETVKSRLDDDFQMYVQAALDNLKKSFEDFEEINESDES
ncbi:MAG: hypothetical protein JO129_01080 [Candidatus Dependentiae bacterium]|nr:hypothetical protein [Candidatus Dependentiae bacterium]